MDDLSKQAILDAKQLRAHITAITKASLEEQFGPTMKKMIQESLEKELDEVDEMEEGKDKTKPEHGKKPVVKEEEEIDEAKDEELEEGKDEELEEAYDEEIDEAKDEELDESEDELDEVLKELEALSEYESELEEADEDEEGAEEELGGEEGIEDEMGEEDEEEIVITFGQLKQALAPFMDAEEGEEFEPEEMSDEEVVNVDEELEEAQVNEPYVKATAAPKKAQSSKMNEKLAHSVKKEAKKHDEEKAKMEETIKRLQRELRETNLLSAKNLYMNKIFAKRSLSESQKFKVISSFDKATTVDQVKTVYQTLSESLTTKTQKTSIRESVGFASKPAGNAPVKRSIIEVDPTFDRWAIIAGLKK
jgi:hypothetical protein